MSPEEHYLSLLQLYMPLGNEIGNQCYEDRYKEVEGDILYNIKKHEPYLDIDHKEFRNYNLFQ